MPRPSDVDWDDNYKEGDTPWDSGFTEAMLVEAVESALLKPQGRTLEIGCGTGTNALYLAKAGFDVVAVDLSDTAIEKAKSRNSHPKIRYEVVDILTDPLPDGSFDNVFDRGCFHVFSDVERQRAFVKSVAKALRPGGFWLSLIGNTEGEPRESGPPRRSALDVISVVEPHLEVVNFREAHFTDIHGSPRAWLCLFRRREQPAQPSTAPES